MSGMSGFIVSWSYIVVVLILFLLSGVWASCSSKRELATWSEGVFFCLSGRGCERGGVDGYSSVSPSR